MSRYKLSACSLHVVGLVCDGVCCASVYIFLPKPSFKPLHCRQVGLADHILHSLEPSIFKKVPPEGAWYEQKKVDCVCFALRIKKKAALPQLARGESDSIEALTAALSQHYANIGQPLKDLAPEEIAKGYFRLNEESVNHLHPRW